MSKKRTRKQKESAKHNFSIHWEPDAGSEAKTSTTEADVKRQLKYKKARSSSRLHAPKYTVDTGDINSLASIRKDIYKSLGLTGFILALELVIYLFWYVK